jgi:hypothetical protein
MMTDALRAAILRYPYVKIVGVRGGEVIVFDARLDTTTVYGTRAGSRKTAYAAALRELAAEYGVQ